MGDRLDILITFSTDAFRVEEEGIERLTGTAEKLIAAIGVILAFQVAELKSLSLTETGPRRDLFLLTLLGMAVLFAGLGFAIWSLRVRDYPDFPDSKRVDVLRNSAVPDEQVRDRIVTIYLDLRDGILRVNERRAGLLRIAGNLLLAGFVADVIGQIGLKLL